MLACGRSRGLGEPKENIPIMANKFGPELLSWLQSCERDGTGVYEDTGCEIRACGDPICSYPSVRILLQTPDDDVIGHMQDIGFTRVECLSAHPAVLRARVPATEALYRPARHPAVVAVGLCCPVQEPVLPRRVTRIRIPILSFHLCESAS